ncbi:hypothetical protein NC651_007260 [Populus alba x Populus x berolinensis]|nr:hypothetical protein NC651_007260 [Populus alba x Populus x berolinensis]
MAYVTNKECRITLTPAIRIHKRLSPPTLANLGCSRLQRDQKQECCCVWLEMPVLTVQLLKLAVGGSEMLFMAHSCTASGDGTLEAHGSCGGRVTGAEWQERCWIWRGGAAVIRLQEGLDRRWEVGSCGWLFCSGLFIF